MENEIWKDIDGYEWLYQISNLGRVKSKEVQIGKRHYRERIMKLQKDKKGYFCIGLTKDGKQKRFLVHRLVANAFMPNPNNYPIINHKDENPSNNFVCVNSDGSVDLEESNIEWCTIQYNNTYGTRKELYINTIIGFDGIHKLGTYFQSAKSAEIFLSGKPTGVISKALNGKISQGYGYTWEYA